jgi:DNA polymerase
VLELRQDGGKSSVAKYLAMKQRACDDGRVRGNLMYHGASTGRWSGAGVQLQNLPRDTVKDWEWSRDNLDPADPKTMGTLSRMIRGCIIPDEGNKLMWVDYASVEARGVAWLAGQKDLVSLFSANGKIYEEMASKVFNVPVQDIGKDSKERFIGKTVVLGCGYSMGALRFRQQCAAMGTDIDEELAQRAVDAYRQGYSMIPALWRGLNKACIASVENMGTITNYETIQFLADKDWLVVRLPSSRKLFYRTPRIIQVSGPFGNRPNIEYMSVNSFTKKWQWERTFGGKLTENIVQGLCRDLIADAMLRLDRSGYEVIASVHDEVICEVPVDGHYTLDEMTKLMCELPDWATGFPLSAEGKEGKRYGK